MTGVPTRRPRNVVAEAPHLLVFPGLFVVLAVAGCVLLREGLRDRRTATS